MPELPIAKTPYTAYLHEAHTYNVLLAYPQYEGWIHENCVQLRWTNGWLFTYMPLNIYTGMPFLYQEWVDLDTITQWHIDMVTFVKNAIDSGEYVAAYVNESYIPEIGGSLGVHNLLVYGYDEAKRQFMLMGFNTEGKYGELSCSFREFRKAYLHVEGHRHSNVRKIIKFSPYQFAHHSFSLVHLERRLYEYLNSVDSDYRTGAIINRCYEDHAVWGIACYEEMEKEYRRMVESHQWIDIRSAYALWEHKVCMLDRLRYLKKYCYLDSPDEVIRQYESVVKASEMLKYAVLKYNMELSRPSRDHSDASRFEGMLRNIQEKEVPILTEVLDMLREKIAAQKPVRSDPPFDEDIFAFRFDHASVPLPEMPEQAVSLHNGDWFMLRNVQLNESKQKENTRIAQIGITFQSTGGAAVQVRCNGLDGICIGEMGIEPSDTEKSHICTCDYSLPPGLEEEICKRDLYFIIRAESTEDVCVTVRRIQIQSRFETARSQYPSMDISRKNYAIKYSEGRKFFPFKSPNGIYHVGHMQKGTYLIYENVDFYKPVTKVILRASVYRKEPGSIEMYLDHLNENPAVVCQLRYTGKNEFNFKEFRAALSYVPSGNHTVLFVIKASDCSLESFWFE